MSQREKEFLKRLLATFKVEAEEHIKTISSGLLELEKGPGEAQEKKILESIYRQAHSLKGSARAVDLIPVESLCQFLEAIFKEFKYSGVPDSPDIFDVLHQTMNTIEEIVSGNPEVDTDALTVSLEAVRDGLPPKPHISPAPTPPGTKSRRRFTRQGFLKGATPAEKTSAAPVKDAAPKTETDSPAKQPAEIDTTDTIRVSAGKLDNLLLQAEEMILMKLSISRRLGEIREIIPVLEDLKKKRTAAAPVLKSLQKDPGAAGEEYWQKLLDYFQHQDQAFREIQAKTGRIARSLRSDHRVFNTMINAHLEDMRRTLMLPFATLTESFPRMVRDMARQKDKEIDLIIKGTEIEIDKRILEEMKDPLIHLVRNAVDHGIETPAERRRAKKTSNGTVEVIITQKEGNKVEITVSDNGRGMDLEKIKEKALSIDLYSNADLERMSERELLALVFYSEFSTSPIITDLSGRGLGLAIVREKVEKLGGRIDLESRPGKGVTFRILVQTTLATFRGILVEASGQRFVVPTLYVEQVLKTATKSIKTVENRETLDVGGESGRLLSYVRLADVLGLPGGQAPEPSNGGFVNVAVVASGERAIAFHVDRVLDEEEVLIKDLGKQLLRVKNVAGATILGTGAVVPILNVPDLVKSAVATAAGASKAVAKRKSPKARQKNVLVVEDSITSRMLLKNILESAGYRVKVAVDGMDGWITLNEDTFDLAVLDVEMPGMSGFELTEKIRREKRLKDVPVVLVTALESREDREKGIDVGADAYIVKSSFDQSNLLEVVKKMI